MNRDECADKRQHKRWKALQKPEWLPIDDLQAMPNEPENQQEWQARIESCCREFQAHWSELQRFSRKAGVPYGDGEKLRETAHWTPPEMVDYDENELRDN